MTDPIALCLAGVLSPQVALMRAVLNGTDPHDLSARLASETGERAAALCRLLGHEAVVQRLRATVAAGAIDHTLEGPQALEMLRGAFDRAVSVSPEASVAAYSLGDARTLRCATAELVEFLLSRHLLHRGQRVLDLGCGIGRVAAAVAPHVASVVGVDISAGMIAEARRRSAGVATLQFELTEGVGLSDRLGRFDLILGVDSFPYLVQAGVAARHVADAARLLRGRGALIIFNLSYRGKDYDRTTVQEWCGAFGFQLCCDGEQPLRLWDATVFIMRRPEGS